MELFKGNVVADQVVWELADEVDTGAVYQFVDEDPQYPGGSIRLMEYIRDYVRYPETSIDNNEQGRVFVDFVIEKDGSISNVNVVRGISFLLDNEAMRVVKDMPDWEPGMLKGRPVRTRIQLPINFYLLGSDQSAWSEDRGANREAYRKQIEDRLTGEVEGEIRLDEISNYVLSSSNLGWINCDRYRNDTREKVDFVVKRENNENTNIKVIFGGQRSIMQGWVRDDGYIFSNIPIGEPVDIIAVKMIKGELHVASYDALITKDFNPYLNYQKCTVERLRSMMKAMRW